MSNRTPQLHILHSRPLSYIPFDVRWVPSSARIAAVGQKPSGSGTIQILEMDEKASLKVTSEVNTPSAVKCLTFGASAGPSRQFATGDFDGKLEIRDIEKLDKPVFSVRAHESLINCLDGAGGSGSEFGPPEIVTGGRDGQVKVWDPRQQGSPVVSFGPSGGETARDTWTVAFGNAFTDVDRMVCAGYDNGDLKMFDLRNMDTLWTTNLGHGVCSSEFDRKDVKMNKLVATTTNSTYYTFDLRTFNPDSGFASLRHNFGGEDLTVWSVRHVPQNRDLFITSCGDGTLQLYKYQYPESRMKKDAKGKPVGVTGSLTRLKSANVAAQPISGFDWSAERLGLCAFTSFDQTLRIGAATKLNLV